MEKEKELCGEAHRDTSVLAFKHGVPSPLTPHSSPLINVIEHPLFKHKLTLMRCQNSPAKFWALLKEISLLLADEVTRDLPLKYESITTPVTTMNAFILILDQIIGNCLYLTGATRLDEHEYIVLGLGDAGDRAHLALVRG